MKHIPVNNTMKMLAIGTVSIATMLVGAASYAQNYTPKWRASSQDSASLTGAWTPVQSLGTNNSYGQGGFFTRGSGSGTVTATATFPMDEDVEATNASGRRYSVFASWIKDPNRCTSVRIEVWQGVPAAVGSILRAVRIVNQQVQGGQWVRLTPNSGGVFFSANTFPHVRLLNSGCSSNTFIIADSALFVAEDIDGGDITDNTVASADIRDNTVGSVDIANSTITGVDVATSGLTNSDISDEAGIDFGSAGSNSLGGAAIANCSSYTTLSSFTVSVPASSNTSYILCQAAGEIDFDTANAEVRVGIDGPDASNFPERQRLLGIEGVNLGSNDETDRKAWAVQNVYTAPSGGQNQVYSLVGCKDEVDAVDPGTLFWDPLACIVVPTRR